MSEVQSIELMASFRHVRFLGHLDLRYVGGENWRLLSPWTCAWLDGEGRNWRVRAETGFVNDLSSIPRAARSVIPVVGPQNKPSVIHDFIYDRQPDGWTRKDADRLFLAGLQAVGVGWLKRHAMYLRHYVAVSPSA